MSIINVANLTFGYEGSYDNVFENVSFQIDTDWKLGFTGRNGRGKTTFLNLLMGNYTYSGSISKNVDFEHFPYEVKDMTKDTLEVMKELCPQSEDWECIREISLLDVEAEALYRPFETLSNGERTKVLLAALFLGSNRFLLIDEPTNHLDGEARKKLGNYLKNKKSFILVSHDRELLDLCTDHTLSINRNSIEVHHGNFSAWQNDKERRDSFEFAENEKLKKEISRLSKGARQSAAWSDRVESSKKGSTSSGSKVDKGYVGHKAAKMMKRAKNQENRMNNAIEKKKELLNDVELAESLKIFPLEYHKDVLLEAKDLSLFYDNTAVCSGINFQVCRGERIAVTGKNGCGKSTLLKLICGKNIEYSGILNTGSNLKISYLSQDTSFLKGTLDDYSSNMGIEASLFKTILRKLGFERIQFEKNIEDYSAGQKKKVLLAGSLCQKCHLYVWDEPLNYIDVMSRIQIEDLIEKYKPTMIFVEHDATFRNKIATKDIKM